ncbi:MAG: hypothetical protein IH942_07865 [Acidobacteria bacterium]|nr:hypothetical protein [Acidobacteriota bacterium]
MGRVLHRLRPERPRIDTIHLQVIKPNPDYWNAFWVRRRSLSARGKPRMETWFKRFDDKGYGFWISAAVLATAVAIAFTLIPRHMRTEQATEQPAVDDSGDEISEPAMA